LSLKHDCTLLLCWSWEEAARYLETFKVYENKQPTSIQERVNEDYLARFSSCLTSSVRSVNKTDATTLASNFGTFRALATATREELSLCPGLGDKKVERLFTTFNASWGASRPYQPAAATGSTATGSTATGSTVAAAAAETAAVAVAETAETATGSTGTNNSVTTNRSSSSSTSTSTDNDHVSSKLA